MLVSKKEFWGIISFICFLNVVLQIWYAGSASDSIAGMIGYQLSFFVVPIFVSQLFPSMVFFATSKPLTSNQKRMLFGIPAMFTVCLVFSFYLVLQYGGWF